MRIIYAFDREAESLIQKIEEEKDGNGYDRNETEDKCADHSTSDFTLNQIHFFLIFYNLFAARRIPSCLCHVRLNVKFKL